MGRVLDRLTYANVMATAALFIALGGAAYALERNAVKSKHIAPNAATGADIKESTLAALGAGILGGELPNLNSLPDSVGFSPIVGPNLALPTASQNNTFLSPRKFVATRLRVKLQDEFTAGSRTFTFSRNLTQPNAELTALTCTITAPARTCGSDARVTYREGDIVSAEVSSAGASGGDDASFGWVALTP